MMTNFKNTWANWERRFMPSHAQKADPLTFWRERIVFIICSLAVVLGPLALVPSLFLAINENLWNVVILDLVAYGTALFIFLGHRLPLRLRAWMICFLLYVLGVGLLFMLGQFGAGYIWLFGASVMMAATLGFGAAVLSLLLNALAFSAVAIFTIYGDPPWTQMIENALEKWMVMGVNFLLLNALVTITTALMLEGLRKALTNERNVSNRLRQSENRFRALIENAPIGILMVDRNGVIKDVNPKLLEILDSPSKEKTRSINMLDDTYLIEVGISHRLKSCLANGVSDIYETAYTSKWGKSSFLRYYLSPLYDENRDIYAAIGIVEDISRQRLQEEQLRRAQKMEALGLMAGGVAHDLNNVLSGIMTYPEFLLLELEEGSPLKKPLLTIKQSGERAADIVQDLLTLTRRGVTHSETLNLNLVIDEYLKSPEHAKLIGRHHHVQLQCRLTGGLLNIRGVPSQLKNALMNLVLNAVEAHDGQGKVVLTTENRYADPSLMGHKNLIEGDYSVLTVEDNGSGIDEEDLKRIFEPFYTKKTMGRSGTGLGMAVVWGMVQDHNGFIDIQSKVGEGTRLELYFPAVREKIEPSSLSMDAKTHCGNGESILVVDDVEEQRQIASAILTHLGYRVDTVSSGEKALVYLKNKTVDLVILDMIMDPGMDGLDTYKGILEIHPGQKAVIASGYAETKRVKKAQRLGAGIYIKKPYTIENLAITIQKALTL